MLDFEEAAWRSTPSPRWSRRSTAWVAAEALAGRRVTAIHLIVDRIPCHSCAPGLGAPHPVPHGAAAANVSGLGALLQRTETLPQATLAHVPPVPGRGDPQGGYWLFSFVP